MSRVIVHHAHHPDEDVYRLIHAEALTVPVHELVEDPPVVEIRHVPNPDYNASEPESEDNPLTIPMRETVNVGKKRLVERTATVHVDHKEIVWDAADSQWEGMAAADIAERQRQIVADALKAREDVQQARTQQPATGTVKHFETGQEL